MFGWSVGLVVSALVLRLGLGAESLAWVAVFALAPLSGVYYPIDVLPGWLQPIAWSLPSSYVFEGMRAVLFENRFRLDLLSAGAALEPGVHGARRRVLPVRVPRRAGARFAAAAGRMKCWR